MTAESESGLMRPVARIAQSVEQGIENPRVLGSIPSPGTTIHKASLKSGAFSFLATVDFWSLQRVICSLDFSPFSQIFVTLKKPRHPLMCLFLTSMLRPFTFPFSKIIHNEVENTWEMGVNIFPYLTRNYLPSFPGGRPGKLLFRQGEELNVINSPCQSGVSTIYSTYNIPVFPLMILRISKIPAFHVIVG